MINKNWKCIINIDFECIHLYIKDFDFIFKNYDLFKWIIVNNFKIGKLYYKELNNFNELDILFKEFKVESYNNLGIYLIENILIKNIIEFDINQKFNWILRFPIISLLNQNILIDDYILLINKVIEQNQNNDQLFENNTLSYNYSITNLIDNYIVVDINNETNFYLCEFNNNKIINKNKIFKSNLGFALFFDYLKSVKSNLDLFNLLNLVSNNNIYNVDLSVGDIYSKTELGLNSNVIASSFAKTDINSSDYDILKSFLFTTFSNIIKLALNLFNIESSKNKLKNFKGIIISKSLFNNPLIDNLNSEIFKFYGGYNRLINFLILPFNFTKD